jgi:hypothetical protein
MMTDAIKKELSKKEMSKFHTELRDKCLNLVSKSRADMSQYYSTWDIRHDTYKAEKAKDRKDVKAQEVKEPAKCVVPLTYAQIDTFQAFGLMNLMQREHVFELKHSGLEDKPKVEPGEVLLHQDMVYNNQTYLLGQFLLDISKFGLGVIKCCWVKEFDYVPVEEVEEPAVMVMDQEIAPAKMRTRWQKVPTWVGNKIFNVSPYKVFPDTRLPLTRYQEGEFCAIEEETTVTNLIKQQKFGMYAGVEHIEPFSSENNSKRGKSSRFNFVHANGEDKENVVLTEVYIDIIPAKVELPGGDTLGDQEFPVRYVVSIANDDRIVKCEPYGYLSRVFPIFLGQFGPDMHELINQSLAEMVSKLQEVCDWFFNSRVASVVRTLDNQMIVDPSGIEMATVTSRSRVILMKKTAARMGPDRFVRQLAVTDVTGRHLEDMNTTAGIMPQVTGVSEQAMGMVAQGRRSAYEMRSVNNASSGRMKKVLSLLWEMTLVPLGKAMLTNHRQAVDFETFREAMGEDATEEEWLAFKGTPEQLVRSRDLFVYDGTLPSDKLYISQSLQEIFTVLISNPQAAVQFNIDPKVVLDEMYRLRGVKLEEFAFTGESMIQQLAMQIAAQLQAANGQQQPQPGQGQANSGPVQGTA